MAKKRLPRNIMAQPLEECALLDWGVDTINEAIGVRWYCSGGLDDGPEICVKRLAHDLWGESHRHCPREGGDVCPTIFQRLFCREIFRWCSAHIATGETGDFIGTRGLGER